MSVLDRWRIVVSWEEIWRECPMTDALRQLMVFLSKRLYPFELKFDKRKSTLSLSPRFKISPFSACRGESPLDIRRDIIKSIINLESIVAAGHQYLFEDVEKCVETLNQLVLVVQEEYDSEYHGNIEKMLDSMSTNWFCILDVGKSAQLIEQMIHYYYFNVLLDNCFVFTVD